MPFMNAKPSTTPTTTLTAQGAHVLGSSELQVVQTYYKTTIDLIVPKPQIIKRKLQTLSLKCQTPKFLYKPCNPVSTSCSVFIST